MVIQMIIKSDNSKDDNASNIGSIDNTNWNKGYENY